MPALPQDSLPEATLAFRRDPYRYISRRCARLGSDAFQTRLLLERATCVTGAEAARLFYDEARFRRKNAIPDRVRLVLFGQGGVQGLDGAPHRHRKALFLEMMTPESLAQIEELTRSELKARLLLWRGTGRVVLHDAFLGLAAEVALQWSGVPRSEFGRERVIELSRLFENAASVGPPYWRARRSRRTVDRWAAHLIQSVREGTLRPKADTPLARLARWRDPDGAPLAPQVAAVELVNVIRPITAAAVWLVFLVHAMHLYGQRPEGREAVRRLQLEVRRLYPFFPALGARATHDFEWRGWRFPKDRLVLLDIYGTNRDPRVWEDGETFNPDRFAGPPGGGPSAFGMIPQGGGDPALTHRCPGEWICERMMEATAEIFAGLRFDVPDQPLALAYDRLPALPRTGLVIENLRAA